MAKRVLFATSGSEGDVHPFIGVALSLKARGLDPIIATRSAFRDKIEREGLGFRPMRPDYADFDAAGLGADAIARGVTHPITGLRFLLRRLAMPFLRQSYDDLMAASEGADLIVAHGLAFAAPLVAEKRDLPWLSSVLHPFSLMSAHDPPVLGMAPTIDALRPALNPAVYRWLLGQMSRISTPWFEPVARLRSEIGLPPDPRSPLLESPYSPFGTLALYSTLLGGVQPDSPPYTHITGFPFYDREFGGSDPQAPELQAFLDAGDPPIVFTLGTTAVLNPGDFFRDSLAAAERLGRRAVLLTGANGLANLPALPPTALVRAYAPHSRLFPRAAVIVHQGGVGASGQALRSGRPQLVTPFMADQPDNAARLKRLGVALTLPRSRYNERTAAKAIATLVGKPAFAERARAAATTIAGENGGETAAGVIRCLLESQSFKMA